jgi:hypothetical protein
MLSTSRRSDSQVVPANLAIYGSGANAHFTVSELRRCLFLALQKHRFASIYILTEAQHNTLLRGEKYDYVVDTKSSLLVSSDLVTLSSNHLLLKSPFLRCETLYISFISSRTDYMDYEIHAQLPASSRKEQQRLGGGLNAWI